jgi:tetratricopeptide (TPR) repeat protein
MKAAAEYDRAMSRAAVKDQLVHVQPRRRIFLANVMVRKTLKCSREGRPREAIAAATRMLSLEPNCAWAYFYRGGLRLAIGDAEGALRDFTALEPLGPGWMLLCRDLQVPPPDVYPQIAVNLKRLLSSDSRCIWLHVFHAFYLRVTEEWKECVAAIDRALKLDPRNPTILAFSARLKYVFRLPAEGVAAMEAAWKLAPECAWINAWLGEVNRYSGNLRRAHALLNRSIERDPHYIIAYSWRGSVRRLLSMPAAALKDINFAIANELVGGDYSLAWAFHERSLLKRSLGRYQVAFRDLKRAHGINLRYTWNGDLYRKDNPKLQSTGLLDSIIARHPDCAWAYAWRAHTLMTEGSSDAAMPDLDRAIRLRPTLAWARAWRAQVYWALGRHREAQLDLRQSLKSDPRYALSHMLQAALHQHSERWEDADKSLATALTLDRVCSSAWAQRGQIAFQRRRYADADRYLTRALELDPNFKDAGRWRRQARARLSARRGSRRLQPS